METKSNTKRRLAFLHHKSFLIVVGLLLAAGALTAGIYLPSHFTHRHLDQVRDDWQMLNVAMGSYGMDRCGAYFPPDTSTRRERLEPGAPLTYECDANWIVSQPVGYRRQIITHWSPLTSPIAYATSIPRDPFNGGAEYGYFSFNGHDGYPLLAVLHSPGPDVRADLDLPLMRWQLFAYFEQNATNNWTLNAEDKGLIRQIVAPNLYDPTNGLRSSGDLVAVYWTYEGPFGFGGDRAKDWAEFPAPKIIVNESDIDNPLRAVPEVCEVVPAMPLLLPSKFKQTLEQNGMSAVDYGPLMNRLGRDFEEIFREPRALTDEEVAAFDDWKKELPYFWSSLDTVHSYTDWSLPPDQFFALLPVLGKCLLLQSAAQLNGPHPGYAYGGPSTIMEIIRINRPRCVEPLAPQHQRVFDELTRLSTAMRAQADAASAAKQAERIKAEQAAVQ